MLNFSMPIVIGLIVSIILSVVFKKSPKIDNGVELNYFRLSYRRKMIRTFVNIPIMILALIIIYSLSDWGTLANTLIGLFFAFIVLVQLAYNFFIVLVQLAYNFFMWKKNEVL